MGRPFVGELYNLKSTGTFCVTVPSLDHHKPKAIGKYHA